MNMRGSVVQDRSDRGGGITRRLAAALCLIAVIVGSIYVFARLRESDSQTGEALARRQGRGLSGELTPVGGDLRERDGASSASSSVRADAGEARAVDVLPDAREGIINDLVEQAPVGIDDLSQRMPMTLEELEPSDDQKVNELLDAHNRKRVGAAAVVLRGKCAWSSETRECTGDIEITFQRDGYVAGVRCSECGEFHVQKGCAQYPSTWGEKGMHSLYFLSLSLQNPKKFSGVSERTIQIAGEQGPHEMSAYVLQSSDTVLYFDKSSGRLAQMEMLDSTRQVFARVTFSDYQQGDGWELPLQTDVQILKKSRDLWSYIPWVDHMVLSCSPKQTLVNQQSLSESIGRTDGR